MARSPTNTARGTVVATAFAADLPGEDSIFPQVGRRSSLPSFQKIYWRCITCLFATSHRCNPIARHVLFCNLSPPKIGDDNFGLLLQELNVEIVITPFTRRDRNSKVSTFGNVMYKFDALEAAARLYPGERIILLDSDCVWLRNMGALEAAIDRANILLYDLKYKTDDAWNGLTPRELAEVMREVVLHPQHESVRSIGGEFIALSPTGLQMFMESFRQLWCRVSERRSDDIAPITEEHFLSLIDSELGANTCVAEATVKRIWTAFRHHNASPNDLELTIWHVPSEKRTGFALLFSDIERPNCDFNNLVPGAVMTQYLAGRFGVPQRSAHKFALDIADRILARVRG